MLYRIIYPERRAVTAAWLIGQAKDHLATEYMRRNPHAEPAAVEENARIADVDEAIAYLDDVGVVTMARNDGEPDELCEKGDGYAKHDDAKVGW